MRIQMARFPLYRRLANATNVRLGPLRVGKTNLAIGLGRVAIELGYSCQFIHAADLVHHIGKAAQYGAAFEALSIFARPHLLTVDKLGYLRLEQQAGNLVFHLARKRYERAKLMLMSNLPTGVWGEMLANKGVATIILDHLLHHSHIVTIKGQSYRLREKRRAGVGPSAEVAN
jgi:DNA replication protein DnaC